MKEDKAAFKTPEKKSAQGKRKRNLKDTCQQKDTLEVFKEKKAKVPINPNEKNKKVVRDMGLGSLLRIAANGITGKMARFAVNSFNPEDMKMHLPKGNIDITPALVHDLLGIPLGGKDMYNTNQCEGKELMDWKQQYNYKIEETTIVGHFLFYCLFAVYEKR
ncbi:unnamed protein product [Lactuca virosa]|uniref:Uncharacterized protein n=1 Tax=Lactuca virosa TaxID=75947 RepID=A0AAU9N8C3_9ASTR|nr:unnamed protein product [Lactuca virosa]